MHLGRWMSPLQLHRGSVCKIDGLIFKHGCLTRTHVKGTASNLLIDAFKVFVADFHRATASKLTEAKVAKMCSSN